MLQVPVTKSQIQKCLKCWCQRISKNAITKNAREYKNICQRIFKYAFAKNAREYENICQRISKFL